MEKYPSETFKSGYETWGKTRAENSYLGIIAVCGSSLGPENRENAN